ncbi:hypothetical protein QUB75_27065 [Microcoleus sp. K1-B6]|uniref:hypothetical protein n=1 Tax=unclassified Microcoleus TaxID=2642155 RepID=UPI002FD63689
MAINWTNLIGNAAGFTVIAGFMWKGLKLAERYVSERTASNIENQRKALAQTERITTLESIIDTIITRQNQQDKFLERWTQGEYGNTEESEYYVGNNEPYHVREDVPNLQKKAVRRYNKIRTDFTEPK